MRVSRPMRRRRLRLFEMQSAGRRSMIERRHGPVTTDYRLGRSQVSGASNDIGRTIWMHRSGQVSSPTSTVADGMACSAGPAQCCRMPWQQQSLRPHAVMVDQAQSSEGLRTYPGLPHRMERVADRDGVLFVNDSKATNAEAAAPALAAYPKVRWIVGGQAKAETLGDTANHLDHVVAPTPSARRGRCLRGCCASAGVERDRVRNA